MHVRNEDFPRTGAVRLLPHRRQKMLQIRNGAFRAASQRIKPQRQKKKKH